MLRPALGTADDLTGAINSCRQFGWGTYQGCWWSHGVYIGNCWLNRRNLYLKLLSKYWFTCFPCLLAMSTSNSGGAQDLTQDEQILHHHAAIIKRDIEAYHAYSRSQEDWKDLFENHLARFILVTHIYKPFSDSFRQNQWTFLSRPLAETQTVPFIFTRYYWVSPRWSMHLRLIQI